jgi:hypothetical protein
MSRLLNVIKAAVFAGPLVLGGVAFAQAAGGSSTGSSGGAIGAPDTGGSPSGTINEQGSQPDKNPGAVGSPDKSHSLGTPDTGKSNIDTGEQPSNVTPPSDTSKSKSKSKGEMNPASPSNPSY